MCFPCRYEFQLKEEEERNQYLLEVAIPRYIYITHRAVVLTYMPQSVEYSVCVCVLGTWTPV